MRAYIHQIKYDYKRNISHFIQDVVGDSFSTEKSLIILNGDEDEVYKKIEQNDGRFKIPHIFLFLQKNIDGRNIQLCMKMQRSTIKEYNEDYDAGIHNVIAFLFSQKPYRLQRIYENKHSLVERWQREKFAETRDFISFTKVEMDYLFGILLHLFHILIHRNQYMVLDVQISNPFLLLLMK